MKKIVLFAAIAAAAGWASCTAQAPKANLKSDIDSLSYMMGISNTQGLQDFAAQRMGVDSANWADFVKGVEDGIHQISKKEKAYVAGLQIGQQVGSDMIENIEKGKAFLAENAKKEGVVTLPSGLQYQVITEGNGKKPSATDRVKCHYEGTLIDGTLFDSSIKRGQPAVFGVNQVIQGWVEALQLMTEGSKWRLFIPSELGYGAQQAGEMIPPHSTLIFEVELLEVI